MVTIASRSLLPPLTLHNQEDGGEWTPNDRKGKTEVETCYTKKIQSRQEYREKTYLTISVLQACCAVTTEYGIPSDFVRKATASLQNKISTAQVNFLNRNVIIF